MNRITRRNERKNRRKAFFYTSLVTISLVAAVFFSDRLSEVPELVKEMIWPQEEVVPREDKAPVAGL